MLHQSKVENIIPQHSYIGSAPKKVLNLPRRVKNKSWIFVLSSAWALNLFDVCKSWQNSNWKGNLELKVIQYCSCGGMRIENKVLIMNCAGANIGSTRAYTLGKKYGLFLEEICDIISALKNFSTDVKIWTRIPNASMIIAKVKLKKRPIIICLILTKRLINGAFLNRDNRTS